MMKIKVKYFDAKKYEADWQQYYKDEQHIHSNQLNKKNLHRLISPTDKGISSYLKDVEIETEKFVKHNLPKQKAFLFDSIIEIDNDYLYQDKLGYYNSHINTLRVVNKYYKKYGNPNVVDLKNGIFGQVERQLKLNQIIDE